MSDKNAASADRGLGRGALMARRTRRRRSIESLFADALPPEQARALAEEFAAFARDVTEMEAPDDPKEKLREKDKKLVLHVNDLFRAIFNARANGDITRTETVILFKIQILFN